MIFFQQITLSMENSVCGVLEFKPHLKRSLGQGPKPAEACCAKARGHEAKSLTSTGMLPHCAKKTGMLPHCAKKNEGLVATLSLKQWKNSTTPPACAPTPRGFSEGLERCCQHKAGSPDKELVEKNFGTPTHPTVAPRPQEGRWHPFSTTQKTMQLKRQHRT